MPLRGVRGAIVADANKPDAIHEATNQLLMDIMRINPDLHLDDIASVIFTVTADLTSAYPAAAARSLGWSSVPLLCAQEIPVPDGLSRCIRVLLLWNTDLSQSAIQHSYLGKAASLRPDLAQPGI